MYILSSTLKDYLGEILDGFAHDANSLAEIYELGQFVNEHREDMGNAIQGVQSALENAEINVIWMEMFSEEVIAWLRDNSDAVVR
jgi:hypothetical protein